MNTLKVKTTFIEATEALSDAEFRRLFRGMMKYASSGEKPDLLGNERILWPTVKEDIDGQRKAHANKSAGAAIAREHLSDIRRNQTDIRANQTDIRRNQTEQRKAEEKAEKGEKKISPLEPPLEENTQREEKEGEKKLSFRARTSVEDAFDEFWAVYPKKVGKKDAFKAFQKVPASERPLLIPAVERQKQSRQWQKDGGQFIPNPSTWLNQGRWLDEEVEQKPLWGTGKIDLSDLQSMLTGRGDA